MSESGPEQKRLQDIILDTCILHYFSDKYISKELGLYLQELVGRGFGLAISDISILELLSNATIKQEEEGLSLLNLFNRYSLIEKVMLATAQLSTLYKQDKVWNDGISTEDKIISSSAILSGSLILTADVNDFPRPFFSEAEEKLVIYRKKNRTNMISIQLLRPNIVYINQRFLERPKG